MMDNLLQDLTSNEIAPRLAALEKTASKLPNKNWLRDVSSDMKVKLMSSTIHAIKDSNPKVVGVALTCMGLLIRNHKDDFSPLINMSFEILLGKLGDNKTGIREQSLQVLLELVCTMSVHATFERIAANITHKNQRVKEGLLAVITRLQDMHGSEQLRAAVSAQTMCTTVSVLLNDAQAGTRQLAVTTLAGLYPTYKEELVDALGRCEIRPAQEKAMLEAFYEQRQRAPAHIAPANMNQYTLQSSEEEVDAWSLLDSDNHATSNGLQDVHVQAARGSMSPNGSSHATSHRDFAQTSRPISQQQQKRSISATPRRPTVTNTANAGFGSTMGAASLASSFASDSKSNNSFAPGDSLGSNGSAEPRTPTSAYDPEGFMHFIQLKAGLKATEIVDERDLHKLLAKIGVDLAKKNDWEARTNALVALQRLAWGNIADFKQSVELIKAMNDLVSTQIIDLRSAVSKEACRAVAALAFALRQQFCPLAEVWWMHLVRVVVVKIQVISSSADKCIRVLVASCPDQRLLVQIMESCTAKAPPLRKLGLEYLCLACAAWKSEAIEKNATALKQVVKAAVADSDAAARKTARQLFWVLHNNPGMQIHMKTLMKTLDAPTQKNLQTEANSDSAEMTDLFRIVQNPSCLLDCVRRADFNSSSKTNVSHSETAIESVSAAPSMGKGRVLSSTSASLRPPTRTSARSAAAPTTHASTMAASLVNAPSAAVEDVISEFDCLMQDEHSDGIASVAAVSASAPITAMKASRRMSLTGPVRILQPTAAMEENDANRTGTVPNSSTAAVISRRQTLSSSGPVQGRSLARSTDFGSSLPNSDNRSAEESVPQAPSTVLSVSSLLQTLGAPLSGASLISGGAVRNSFEAKTPAVKSSYTSATSTRPSFITRQEEDELPSYSQSFAVPEDTPDMFASEHFNDTPALSATNSSAASSNPILSRRGSLGSTTSALGNGPKRIVRPVPTPAVVPASAPSAVAAVLGVAKDAPVLAQVATAVKLNPAVQKTSALLAGQVSAKDENTVGEEVRSLDDEKEVFIFSGETLRTMVADEHWDTRVKAFESINTRLQRASTAQEKLNEVIVETFVDLSLSCLADTHQKVATEALTVLQGCVAAYPQNLKSRLGAVLLALFHRLADRRPALRDQANSVLNLVRTSLDSVLIMTALSPRMGEVPDRMKTALMQFMGAVAPHCDAYFQVSSNAWAFLSRMAHIIGSSGAKPSLTLTVAARRLLELVYKTSPQVICAQIAALPLQQQITLKKYLEASIPDIDHQVTLASKTEWSSKVHGLANEHLAVSQFSPEKATLSQPNHNLLDVSTMSSVFEIRTNATDLADSAALEPSLVTPRFELDAFTTHSARLSISNPLPSPAPVSAKASPQRSPVPPAPPAVMEFIPRNLSAAAVEVEVRVREYLDALLHAQSPSENVSPNSPPASSSKKMVPKASSHTKMDVYSPPFVSPEDPVLNAVLVSRLALDAATEEIIQRYSPKKSTPSAHQTLASVLDPLSASVALAYGDYGHDSAFFRNTVTPQRPSQLPQRRSLAGPSSAGGVNQTTSPQSVEESSSKTLSTQKKQGNLSREDRIVDSTPHKELSSGTKRASPLSTNAQFADHNDIMRSANIGAAASGTTSKPASSSKAPLHASPAPITRATAAGSVNGAKKSELVGDAANTKSISVHKDTLWLLEHLKPSATLSDRDEASKDLKQRIKSASDSYWMQNYAQVVTILLDSFRAEVCPPHSQQAAHTINSTSSGSNVHGASKVSLAGYEHVEFSTKSLLLFLRYRAPLMKNLIEVLADKLCRAGEFVPQPIAQSLEMVLSELSKQDAIRLVTALLPYATLDTSNSDSSKNNSDGENASGGSFAGENPQVRILALHALCSSIKHLSSAQLLSLLPRMVPAVLSSVNSSLADLRKAVIFILVEIYLSVGDSLFPFVSTLTPPQRKLLTIYIEKRLNERKQSVNNGMSARS